MCGIAGAAWTNDGAPLPADVLARMIAVLAHRGPDEEGTFFSDASRDATRPAAALGHRRLSIIDLDGGRQPLCNEDETVWIAFNGEIYNFAELRRDLQARGHRFRTHSDTETIVHLYEEYGTGCLQHLRGMFAFALWDDHGKRLFLARDRLGQKPLFYREEAGRLLFASELKALLQVPGVPRRLNRRAVDAYLTYQYVPHPDCILDGYAKLPPAHFAVYANGTLRVERYWSPPFAGDAAHATQSSSPGRWREELHATLSESVKLRLRSDVPLGAFLSGGIDSTIITGLMQRHSDTPVHTFSIGFPVKRFDESSYARETAEFLGTQHHEFIVEPSALEVLPKLIWHYDEPFADSSAIPMMSLSEMTRKDVTVALSGDGGDELFAGYDRYRAVRLASWFDSLPRPLRAVFASPFWQRLPSSLEQKSFSRRLKRFLGALREPPEARYLTWISIFDAARRRALYTEEFRESLDGFDATGFLLQAYRQCEDRDFVTRTSCADALTYLPCDILTKVDIAGMAYGLECRSPFLDHRVAELAARMPIELKLRGRRGKRILRETFAELIPPAIDRRPKMGFGVPLDHWFRNELAPLLRETILSEKAVSRGCFRPEAVRRLVDEHTGGQWDHSYRLWALLVLEMWQQTFLDAECRVQ
ncbi:MAG: asparagine synthase (glutamine-hydrolyzing) [Planctomycetaceae bacterium]